MNSSKICTQMKTAIPVIAKRNICASSALMASASDPIQKLFLDKLREYKEKINSPKFLEENPLVKKEVENEYNRLTKQYGGQKPEDLAVFPTPTFKDDLVVDPQKGF